MEFKEIERLFPHVINWDKNKRNEIKKGIENGLTISQINIYANKNTNFNYSQMEQIRKGLEYGLSDKEVSIYAHSDWSWQEMKEYIDSYIKYNETTKQLCNKF